jgi:hypothetical protein
MTERISRTDKVAREVLRLKQRGENERGVALLSAIIFIIIMAGISVVLLSAVLGQIAPANNAQKGTRTIYAAQAGLQTTLGLLRSAAAAPDSQGLVFGSPSKLPCATAAAPLTGNVDALSNGVTYSVQIIYFNDDPTGKLPIWQNDPLNQTSCAQLQAGIPPSYAMLMSTGHAPMYSGVADSSPGDRKLSAIYKFKASNVNIAGGRIYDYGNQYCLDAAAASSNNGTMTFQPLGRCNDDPNQLWVYDTDYKIKLASSIQAGAPLCITGPAREGDSTQDATLQPCRSTTDPARWNQLWSWTGAYSWVGQKQDIASGPSNYCLATGKPNGSNITNKRLQVSTGCNGQFAPSTRVGAGAAGFTTHQLVNYQEFGRCADVTNEQIGYPFMISYPCKQDPSGLPNLPFLKWNHKWYYSEPTAPVTSPVTPPPTQVSTTILVNVSNDLAVSSSNYCLETPDTGTGSTYPVFRTCTGGVRQSWTRVGVAADYLGSYLLIDSNDHCLTADPSNPFNLSYSKITVATCTGSLAQKWNAPAAVGSSTVGGYREVSG